MSARALRLTNVGAATLVIGGALVAALPQHAPTVLRLVVATLAGAAAVYAVAIHVPTGGWLSPFKWMSPFNPGERRGAGPPSSGETSLLRSKLFGWRVPVEGGAALPPDVVRLLRPLLASALGLEREDERRLADARERVSPHAWSILTMDLAQRPRWLPKLLPNPSGVALEVAGVLDEIDRLAAGVDDSSP